MYELSLSSGPRGFRPSPCAPEGLFPGIATKTIFHNLDYTLVLSPPLLSQHPPHTLTSITSARGLEFLPVPPPSMPLYAPVAPLPLSLDSPFRCRPLPAAPSDSVPVSFSSPSPYILLYLLYPSPSSPIPATPISPPSPPPPRTPHYRTSQPRASSPIWCGTFFLVLQRDERLCRTVPLLVCPGMRVLIHKNFEVEDVLYYFNTKTSSSFFSY